MTGLRETHVSAGRETQDAIGAVHRTLETIIGRLGDLESGSASTAAGVAALQRRGLRQPSRPKMPGRLPSPLR